MKIESLIFYKYCDINNIEKYYFISEHTASYLYFKSFNKIIYPYWINNRLKEIEKLYVFHKYKRYLEDIQKRKIGSKNEVIKRQNHLFNT